MNVGVHQRPPASSSMLDHGTQSLKASRSDVTRLENEQPKRQKQASQRSEMASNVSSPGGSPGNFTTSRKSRRRAPPPQRFEEFTAEEERSLRAAIENSKRLVAIVSTSHHVLSVQTLQFVHQTPELDVDVPEAPVFYPTVEEFADPIAYIKKCVANACIDRTCVILRFALTELLLKARNLAFAWFDRRPAGAIPPVASTRNVGHFLQNCRVSIG